MMIKKSLNLGDNKKGVRTSEREDERSQGSTKFRDKLTTQKGGKDGRERIKK
ncbi:hypothetical protein CSE_01170 [Caldisericum exile AZM16c01]|uniref:Uncharacterized protein n=1 Tax=Caldisericum exile (strain DSM 21853 / NBRC 104410 / AZM16c01) TaxID=511051 RepID=A0A7U6GD54_CALEA|nr:hypothetical protein CSE_01170 [Caldisericum exile AZM16c01]